MESHYKRNIVSFFIMLLCLASVYPQEEKSKTVSPDENASVPLNFEKENGQKEEEKTEEKKEDEEKKESEGEKESYTTHPEKEIQISGSAGLRYRLKVTDDESDSDIYGDLRLEIKHIVPDKVFFSFFGRGIFDAGGGQESGKRKTDFFRDVYDSYGSIFQGRLYHAYFTLDDFLFPDTLFRIGRQTYYADQSFDFDGGYGEFQVHKMLKILAFGGASVYHFKGPRGGDWLVGTGAELTPIRGTQFNLDYVYLQEYAEGEGRKDYEVIVRLRQQIWEYWYLLGQFTVLNDQAKDMSLTSTCHLPDYDFQIRVRFYALINELEDINSSISGFFGSYRPYQQYEVNISKGFGEYFTISGGYTGRVLGHSRDESTFNREFHRFHGGASVENWPIKGFEASVTVQGWVTNGTGDNDLIGVDAEISHRFSEELKVSLGTSYELYDYERDYQQINERVGVTTVYIKANYQANEMFSFFGEFEWEYDEERDFYLMELGTKAKF